MADPNPEGHPLWPRFQAHLEATGQTWKGDYRKFNRFIAGKGANPYLAAKEHRRLWAAFLAGFEAGAAQEMDDARRDSAAARPHTDRANAAAVERLCATMRGLPAAPGWRVTTVWGTFDAG
jgi:hypothetical protein